MEGILMVYGEEVNNKSTIKGTVLDIAPTILHLFNLPIPNNIDGKILKKIFKDKSIFVKRKPMYVDAKYYLRKMCREEVRKRIREIKKKI